MSDGNAPEVVPADPRARRAAFAILALGLVVRVVVFDLDGA
jgi:hypothetical protein